MINVPKWLVDMRESVPIHFIETQRLPSPGTIEHTTKAMFALYTNDAKQKPESLDELARKRELLTDIINSRFLYKTMTIDKEKGLVFTTKNGLVLSLENLSSGEQHELVLFYDLLFRVNPGSLVLIDEPELSLHVVWQDQFLKDLQRVRFHADADIILATHSPDIINDRRDLIVELRWPTSGGL
jgi:predicted ATPase